jgi:hypothetical protein
MEEGGWVESRPSRGRVLVWFPDAQGGAFEECVVSAVRRRAIFGGASEPRGAAARPEQRKRVAA